MLSYRHAFHAGNHADVLKHFVLTDIARYLIQKDTPCWYIDTHAGAGGYMLDEGYATKLSEYKDGIARLWEHTELPPALQPYLDIVREFNGPGALRYYPGSPVIAAQSLRPSDKLRLFELHSSDVPQLGSTFRDPKGKRVIVTHGDGLAGLLPLLPPPPRRALVLIDPSYELRSDYAAVLKTLTESLRRFATGTYALWYPCLARMESRELPDKLKKLSAKSWLRVELNVRRKSTDGMGMHGSGMFILNPPWTLHKTLQETMPWLTRTLAQDDGAGFVLEQHENA